MTRIPPREILEQIKEEIKIYTSHSGGAQIVRKNTLGHKQPDKNFNKQISIASSNISGVDFNADIDGSDSMDSFDPNDL